ncbi:MAG: hypothetical protein AAFN92_20465, partial [Bacteroidota bacterium]
MRSVFLSLTLLFTLLSTSARAQLSVTSAEVSKNTWGRVSITGRADNFAVTPSGSLFCATAVGALWQADSVNGSWSMHRFS